MTSQVVPIAEVYEAIGSNLKSRFPAFARSPEYELVTGNDDLPGVILAAFARYLIRRCSDGIPSDEIEDGIAIINALYDARDRRIRTAVRDEFAEAFDGASDAVQLVRPLLSERLAEAFGRVLG